MAEDACKMKQKRMRKRMLRTRSMMRKVSMMSMMRRRKSVKGGITMVRVFFPTRVPFIFSMIV